MSRENYLSPPASAKSDTKPNFPRRRGFSARLFRAVLARPSLCRRISSYRRNLLWRRLGVDVSPAAFIAPEARLFRFLEKIHIGEGSLLGVGAELHAWDSIDIGRNVLISQGARVLTGSHDYNCPKFSGIGQPVSIGDHAWIGAYAIVLPGVKVGEGAVVGAGAVVTHDVPAYAVVAGNPARVVGEREKRDWSYIPAQFP